MYIPFRNTKNWLAKQIEDCKTIPDVNSRICFLGTSVTIAICMLILTIGLFYSDRVKEDYVAGIGMLLGGHGVSAWGRFKTKANGGDGGNGNGDPAPDPAGQPGPSSGSVGDKG